MSLPRSLLAFFFFFFFHASTAEKYKFVAYFGIYLLMKRVNIICTSNTFTVGISIQLLLSVLELLSHLVSVWIHFVLFTLQLSLRIFLAPVKFNHVIQTAGMINISKKNVYSLNFGEILTSMFSFQFAAHF